jgi:hypothetical protein
LTNFDPARRIDEGVKGAVSDGRPQEIAVESRDAERIIFSVGEATARTYESYDQMNPPRELIDLHLTNELIVWLIACKASDKLKLAAAQNQIL